MHYAIKYPLCHKKQIDNMDKWHCKFCACLELYHTIVYCWCQVYFLWHSFVCCIVVKPLCLYWCDYRYFFCLCIWHFMQIVVRLRAEFKLLLIKLPFLAGWCSHNDFWRSLPMLPLSLSLCFTIKPVWLQCKGSKTMNSKQLITGWVIFSSWLCLI